jgi:hypothetical protein
MQEPNILPRHNMNQLTRLDMSNLNETWLERQYVRVVQREALRRTFPLDLPVRARTPAISIDEEAEIRIVEQELPIQTFYVNGLYALLARDEIKGGVGLIEEGLAFSCFEGHDFEALGTADTERTAQVVD